MEELVRLSEDARGHSDKDPALTVDREGSLWVVWQSYRARADRILARRISGGERGPLYEISEQAGVNFLPTVACDGEGRIWVLWTGMRDGHWQILARSIAEGKSGPVSQLSGGSTLAYGPQVAVDGEGHVWAAWVSVQGGEHQIVGSYREGERWSPLVPLGAGPGEHLRPVLCAMRKGVWLAYDARIERTRRLFLRRWTPIGAGTPMLMDLTSSWEVFPRMCVDSQGHLWAAWIAMHDVMDRRGIVDHKVEIMAAHYDGFTWLPYRSPDRTKSPGYVAHLYDGLLGRQSYWGFVGHRRRPQLVCDDAGEVWVLYKRKEDETVNRRGPDALFYAKPLTGLRRDRTYEVDRDVYAYVVNGDLLVSRGQLLYAGQIPSGAYYGDICAGALCLDRSRPVRTRPASQWKSWQAISLPGPSPYPERPTMQVGALTYRLYWGDTHCHGTLSGDAEGEIDELYAYGRYKAGLDFMAITENDSIYDDTLTTSAWALLRAEASHYNDAGEFVTFSGFERTYRDPSGEQQGPNHRTVLYRDDAQPLYRCTEPDANTLGKFVERMECSHAFVYPHHATWWLAPSSRLGGVEVCSSWGVYLLVANTVPQALRQGYRLAFIGSSDSHRAVPGLGGALTGVWAEELTREAIMEALWARRCYATNGERIVLDVSIEGQPMGAEVVVSLPVVVHCHLQAPRPILRVDLYRDGERVRGRDVVQVDATFELVDRPEPGGHFYYLQVQVERRPRAAIRGRRRGNLQVARGDYARSSPIWVQVSA